MLQNYFKIAWRNIIRNKLYSFIIIIGLAIGIVSCLFIFVYIQDELSCDRHWESADRIVRVNQIFTDEKGVVDPYASSANALGPILKDNFPEIEQVVRIDPRNHMAVSYENNCFNEDKQFLVDTNFLQVFPFELLKGNPKTCLKKIGSIVISEDMAARYFGSEDPIGKVLQYPGRAFTVTGVLKKSSLRSHLNPNALLSMRARVTPENTDWFRLPYFTYVKFRNAASVKGFDKKLELLSRRILDPAVKSHNFSFRADFKSQPLTDIYFDHYYNYDQFQKGEKKYLPLFGWVAVFILIIACFNYMNLATSRALKRSKEVGLRKVAGAGRSQVILQFFGESFLLSTFALLVAIFLVALLVPELNWLTGKSFSARMLFDNPGFWFAAVGLLCFISIVAGSYPAFYLSGFRPARVLKGKLIDLKEAGSAGRTRLRQLMVIGQFSISTIIIIATLVVREQLMAMKNKDLGFNTHQVLVMKLPANMDSLSFRRLDLLRNDLLKNPAILNFASTAQFVGAWRSDFFIRENGRSYSTTMNVNWGGYTYLDLLDIRLVQGRKFSREISSDSHNFILNEAAVKFLNWKEPLAKELSLDGKNYGRVIGVVRDYNYKSPHSHIEPLVLALAQEKTAAPEIVLVKIQPTDIAKSMALIETKWKEYFPRNPISASFLDDKYNEQYQKESSMLVVFTGFSGVAIVISCLGLLGLASYSTEQRVKEIGIRKVLGATVSNIMYLVSKDFLLLILLAIVIAVPVAYYFADSWLQDFAYRTTISIWLFILAGFITITIAFLSVFSVARRAASANPVKSLRSE